MVYEIKLLDLIDIDLEASFLVLGRGMGTLTRVKTWGCLILGGDDPILVDTGAMNTEIMGRLGMTGFISEEQRLENQLARYGVKIDDVRWVMHTHHHIDHAGQDDRFTKATVITTRRELEYSASGIMGEQYPAEYVKHHIDRLHTPGAMRLLDLDYSRPEENFPRFGGASLTATQHHLVEPIYQVLDYEPQSTGNQGTSKRQERGAIKRALNSGTFVIPIHDYPARVDHGRIVSRLGDSIPGPETPVEHRTVSETKTVVHT